MNRNIFISFFTALTLVACGSAGHSTSSDVSDVGTTNDLPNPILQCVETHNGATVNDGRVELTIGKDQFGQLSALVVQKDQFSGDSVLAQFLAVQKIDPNHDRLNFDARNPDVVYQADENGKQMELSLRKNKATPSTSVGHLVLSAKRIVELSCED